MDSLSHIAARLRPNGSPRFARGTWRRAIAGAGVLAACICAGSAAARSAPFPMPDTFPIQAKAVRLFDVFPIGECAVTSLVSAGGLIYGATSGERLHVFSFDPATDAVRPLGQLAGPLSVHHALAVAGDGRLYIGTEHYVDLNGEVAESPLAGHLFVVAGGEVSDLGQPVPGQDVHVLAIDDRRGVLYGLTTPDGHLFRYDLASREARDLGVITRVPRYESRAPVANAMLVTHAGNVITAGKDGRLIRYDAARDKVETLRARLPGIPGRPERVRLDAIMQTPYGTIYGATSDGYLFRYRADLDVLTNLGKPLRQGSVAALVEGADGSIYGVCGEDAGIPHLFRYNPPRGGYDLLGLAPGAPLPIGGMVVDEQGRFVLGERGRRAHLRIIDLRPEPPAEPPAE